MRSAFLHIATFTGLSVAAAATSCSEGGNSNNNDPGSNAGGAGGSGNSNLGGFDLGSGGGSHCEDYVTCKDVGANCGPINDGCGNLSDCGTCTGGESCGGGGEPSVCGVPTCTPRTCADQSIDCGPAGDGCGNPLACGACTGSDTCGGGGPGVCGTETTCVPKTCDGLGFDCGPAGDGCGKALDCGTCSGNGTCGGGGTPSVCGTPPCDAQTCADFGGNACGPIGDGCGGLVQCGGCNLPETCGPVTVSHCGVPPSCTNLCLQQVSCSGGGTTTVSGTVYAPNGIDPLPNILVYVPNSAIQPFSAGVSCDRCADGVSGSPLVSAATGNDGRFTIANVPVGTNIPLVMQTGRWRRKITLPTVSACVDNPIAQGVARLPRDKSEGDIPRMAFSTGDVDTLECVIRKMGVADGEFTNPSGSGRVNLFQGLGNAGARINSSTPDEGALLDSATVMSNYDMILFPCQGSEYTSRVNAGRRKNIVDYTSAGGRIFATHYSYVWLDGNGAFDTVANWQPGGTWPTPDPQTGFIDMSFPKGESLGRWLFNIGASTVLGQMPINTLRYDFTGVVAPSQLWVSVNQPGVRPMHFTFNTPVGKPADEQCGRAVFSDFHVENHSGVSNKTNFPAECSSGAMTPQEKMLMFMIFDLGSCITPDIPVCTPVDCAAQNIGCGPAGNGCGEILDCGPCVAPATCGGGGQPSQCGTPTCSGLTCANQGIACGPAGDGCGNALDCGPCGPGQTCGGGGTPGVCGSGTCNATTCAAQGIECGPAGDGCGNPLDCGPCPPGQTCGGGGTPGVCGTQCDEKTCASLGFDCGPAGDGCGGQLHCGTCNPPQTCGGGGTPNKCGGSVPH